jgi:exportin-2 (importin alpha re-exporter)
LIESYLSKGAKEIAEGGQLPPILGVFQKLIASRMNDIHGFDLISAVFEYTPQ